MTVDRRWPMVSCVAIAVAIGMLDLATGSEVSVALFYLVPIALATWFVGTTAGLGMCGVATILRVADIAVSAHPFSHPLTPYWNAGIELGFFGFTATVLGHLRAALVREAGLARTDPLTGLLNRRAFWERATVELARAERHGGPLSLAYFDLDDFKRINDQGGHAVGDRVLAQIATTLQRHVRATDAVARVGGDEFLVLFPETVADDAGKIVAKLATEIRAATRDVHWEVSVSVGVVTVDLPQISVDQLISEADALAYAAKRGGKNHVRQAQIARDELRQEATPPLRHASCTMGPT